MNSGKTHHRPGHEPEFISRRPFAAIILLLIISLLAWQIDALLDYFVYARQDSSAFSFLGIPFHEICLRFIVIAAFVGFGVYFWRILTRVRLAHQELQESEERYRQLVELSPVGIGIHCEGKLVFVNPAATRILGASRPEELLGKEYTDFVVPDRSAAMEQLRAQMLQEWQAAPVLELEVRRIDGTYLTGEIHSAPLMYQGKPAVMVVGLDITESKRAAKALQESEQRLELALKGADLGLWDYNLQTGEAYISPRRAEMVGYSPEELEPHISSWAKQVHPEDQHRVWEAFNAHVKGLTPSYECEHRLRHKAGHYVWILARAKVVEWDDKGNPVRMVGTSLDITERKKAEQALKESEERLELALEAGHLGMWDWNIRTGEMLFSPYGLRMAEVSREKTAFHFSSWGSRVHPDDISGLRTAFNAHFEEGTPFFENEHRLRTDSGRWVWNLARGKIVERDKDGKPLRMIGINQGITRRKLAEQALRESEERYRTLVELAPVGIAIHCDGTVVFVNKAAVESLRVKSADDIVGRSFTDFTLPHLREALIQRRDKMLAEWQPAPVVEVRGPRGDGTPGVAELRSAPIMYDGKPAIMVVALDITDRKKAEEQVQASLEEKEILLREIHHRVKNNLQVMASLLALQSGYIGDQGYANMLQDAERRIYSMALVHENLYRSENLARIKMDSYIQTLVTDLFASYRSFTDTIHVKIDAEEVLLSVDTAVPCGLILNELLSNALKHAFPMGRKGEIRISFHAIGENEFQLTVADDGIGMAENPVSVKTRSFGLDLVKTLVDQLHGQIAFNRAVGTEFRITFREMRRQRGGPAQ